MEYITQTSFGCNFVAATVFTALILSLLLLQREQTMLITEFMEGGDLYHAIARDTLGRFAWCRRQVHISLNFPCSCAGLRCFTGLRVSI